jgi:hypothetical protein
MIDLPDVFSWLFWLSVAMFLASLIGLPILIIQMPSDYFVRSSPSPDSWRVRHPVVRALVLLAKNACGLVLLLAGLIMLFTPGQGVLAILVGLSLMDVPGKKGWERRLVAIPRVQRVLNAIRARAGRPPLEVDQGSTIRGTNGS